MAKFYLSFLIFLTAISVQAETLYVETILDSTKDYETLELQAVAALENGLVDQCFDQGWMVFNNSISQENIQEGLDASLEFARRAGAVYMMRIWVSPSEERIQFYLYSADPGDVLSWDNWELSDREDRQTMTLVETFYQAGTELFYEMGPRS